MQGWGWACGIGFAARNRRDRSGNKALALSSFSFKVLAERRQGAMVSGSTGGREISALEE